MLSIFLDNYYIVLEYESAVIPVHLKQGLNNIWKKKKINDRSKTKTSENITFLFVSLVFFC